MRCPLSIFTVTVSSAPSAIASACASERESVRVCLREGGRRGGAQRDSQGKLLCCLFFSFPSAPSPFSPLRSSSPRSVCVCARGINTHTGTHTQARPSRRRESGRSCVDHVEELPFSTHFHSLSLSPPPSPSPSHSAVARPPARAPLAAATALSSTRRAPPSRTSFFCFSTPLGSSSCRCSSRFSATCGSIPTSLRSSPRIRCARCRCSSVASQAAVWKGEGEKASGRGGKVCFQQGPLSLFVSFPLFRPLFS